MAELVLRTDSPRATEEVGRLLSVLMEAGDVVLLAGDLGAGKTQLTKGIARGLGVAEPVTSPTFNILLVHSGRLPLYHLDLYRLERAEELEDLDYYGTIEADGVAVVEWGDRFAEAAPVDGLLVTLLIEGDDERRLEVVALGARGCALADRWAQTLSGVAGVALEAGDAS